VAGDRNLVREAQGGDREALERLLASQAGAAYALALAVTANATDAEDACQEAFLRATRDIARYRGESPFRAWLLRIVRDAAVSLVRARAARRRREEKAPMPQPARGSVSGEKLELSSALRGALMALEERYRLPVMLHYQQDLSHAEAAEVLDQPVGTVSSNISRGLDRLRRSLARNGYTAAGGALALALAGAPKVAAPVTLLGSIGNIVGSAGTASATGVASATGAAHAGTGIGTAASAAAKGGVVMKVVAGIVAAGALAGALAVSTGMTGGALPGLGDGKPAPVNPYKGMQEREEVFEFAAKPAVKKEGEAVVITFASKGKCDATVAILDKDGKIVRHLASGVLGANAPHPFQQNSLSQKLKWDGNDDMGKKAPAGCKVRISLGLKAEFDKSIAYDHYGFPVSKRGQKNQLLVGTGSDGNTYVLSYSRSSILGRVYGKDGKYVRTFLPVPAEQAVEMGPIMGHKIGTTQWGDKVMVTHWFGPFAEAKETDKALPKLAPGVTFKPGAMPANAPAPTASGVGAGLVGIKYFHLAADRARDEIYTGTGGQYRFDGKTGNFDETWFPKEKLGGKCGTDDVSVGPDGLIYLRFGPHGYGRYLFRTDRSGKLVPFKKEHMIHVAGGKGWWENVPAAFKATGVDVVFTGTKGHSLTHSPGLYAAPNGLIVVSNRKLEPAWAKKHKLATEVKGAHVEKTVVSVFAGDGKLLSPHTVVSYGSLGGQGVAMDRDGSIYAIYPDFLPVDQGGKLGHTDIQSRHRIVGGCGALVKFRGQGGKYPLNTGAAGAKIKGGWSSKKIDLPGSLWAYGGIIGQCNGACQCNHVRNDTDFFARTFVAANQCYSVIVIDANANFIARIGRYGNVDDEGIRIAWPRAIAASDEALYIGDHANRRVLRAKLGYAAEEELPVP